MEKLEKNCGTCDWHIEFSGVCVNGASPYCADYTMNNQCCKAWEMSKDIKNEKAKAKKEV